MELPTQPSDSSSNEEEPLLNSRLYKSLSAIELSQYSSRSRCIEPILTASRSEWSLSYMNRNSCIQHLDMVDCMAMAEWHPLDQHYNNTFSDQAGTSVSPAENSLQTTNGTSSTLRMSAACSISIQKFNSDKEMFANMKATMVKTQQQMSSISKMAFNSNTNPDGGDRPMSFADSDSFHRNELRNGHLNTPNSSMANHQFRFNVNAPAFIPRGSPAYGASQIGGSNSGWGRDPSHFGGSSDWMDGDAFTMSHNQVPGNVNRTSTAPRRNIYGTQYSQATLDSNFFGHQAQDPLRSQHPHYDSMSRNGFDDGAMFHSTSRNSLFDVASPMSMSYSSDPAVLLQQMESLGLSVRFDSTLNFSPSLTDRMNRSSYADTLREICVGLEQLCRPDIADNQSSEWDIAIKRCVLQLANQCSQRHASEDTVRELCSIVMSMVYESVHLKTGTSKRLAVLVGNILYHVPYFRDIFLYEISLFSLSQPLTVTKTADSLTFLSHVYLKLVHMHCTLPRIAMRIIEFITSLIELKPITDHHLLPIVSVLKLIGEHLDQYPDVRNRLNVVLTNVLGYAVGYHHTVSARTRTAVQGVIKIREDGWQSVKYRGYPYQRPGFDVDDDMLTEAEQRFVDGQIARNTPEVVESLDDDIQEDFERFLDASAQTALGVANSCLEEFSELSVKDTKPCGASTESGDVNAEKKSE